MVIEVNTGSSPENFISVVFLRYRIAITNLRKVKAPGGYQTDVKEAKSGCLMGHFQRIFR